MAEGKGRGRWLWVGCSQCERGRGLQRTSSSTHMALHPVQVPSASLPQLNYAFLRRHFLLQCLALLQYIEQPSKTDKSAIGQRPEGLEAMRDKVR